MDYYGTNDDRQRADEIHAAYVENMKGFVRWLVDSGRRIRLFVGDTCDVSVVHEILADLRAHRPHLDPAWVIAEPVTSFAELMRADGPRQHRRRHPLSQRAVRAQARQADDIARLRREKPRLMADMGLCEFCQSANSPDADQLIQQFKELESRSAELRQTIIERNTENARLLNQQFEELSAALFPDIGSERAQRSDIYGCSHGRPLGFLILEGAYNE